MPVGTTGLGHLGDNVQQVSVGELVLFLVGIEPGFRGVVGEPHVNNPCEVLSRVEGPAAHDFPGGGSLVLPPSPDELAGPLMVCGVAGFQQVREVTVLLIIVDDD